MFDGSIECLAASWLHAGRNEVAHHFDVTLSRMRPAVVAVLAVFSASPIAAQGIDRWEKDIAAFEAVDKMSPPQKGGIVFVGSSTIRRWDTASSFPDLKILNRGFGGSELADAVRYVDRIVTPYEPRLVVVYSGDNDIAAGQTSEDIAVQFERFTRAVHAKLPQTRILLIAVKPSLLRWPQIDRMRMANTIMRAYCERDDRLAFVDFDSLMLGWDEKPRRELFVEDGLHLSPQGYQLWSTVLRPWLTAP
jgi:lysophospholipase L1-like esterase